MWWLTSVISATQEAEEIGKTAVQGQWAKSFQDPNLHHKLSTGVHAHGLSYPEVTGGRTAVQAGPCNRMKNN
jgi:hypothetical protein